MLPMTWSNRLQLIWQMSGSPLAAEETSGPPGSLFCWQFFGSSSLIWLALPVGNEGSFIHFIPMITICSFIHFIPSFHTYRAIPVIHVIRPCWNRPGKNEGSHDGSHVWYTVYLAKQANRPWTFGDEPYLVGARPRLPIFLTFLRFSVVVVPQPFLCLCLNHDSQLGILMGSQ